MAGGNQATTRTTSTATSAGMAIRTGTARSVAATAAIKARATRTSPAMVQPVRQSARMRGLRDWSAWSTRSEIADAGSWLSGGVKELVGSTVGGSGEVIGTRRYCRLRCFRGGGTEVREQRGQQFVADVDRPEPRPSPP